MFQTVLVGNPNNRRAEFFQHALKRAGLPSAHVVPYRALLDDPEPTLERLRALTQAPALVRLESPGEDFAVTRALIALGAETPDPDGLSCERISAAQARELEQDIGRILAPRQWYLGYCALMQRVQSALGPGALATSHADDVAAMFDKVHTHRRCREAGVEVPEALEGVRSYEELRERMREAGWSRVFVKIRNGSSASGVVAYTVRGEREVAVTSAERVEGPGGRVRLYNNLRLSRYTRRAHVAQVIDTLAGLGGLHVERWIPKLSLNQRRLDVRVVVIDGHARHAVVRTSPSPLTNLHLGNARGELDPLVEIVTPSRWREGVALCVKAAACFTHTLHCGVDLMVHRDRTSFFVAEVNVYGDLLPRVTWEGRDTYGASLEAAAARLGHTVNTARGALPYGPAPAPLR